MKTQRILVKAATFIIISLVHKPTFWHVVYLGSDGSEGDGEANMTSRAAFVDRGPPCVCYEEDLEKGNKRGIGT